MKKALSIVLMTVIFVSVTGYTVPCTIHCMNMNEEMEMCHHDSNGDMDCDGSCMAKNLSDKEPDTRNNPRADSFLLTQYRVNLLGTSINLHHSLINPLTLQNYLNDYTLLHYSDWLADPIVPPPKLS